LSDQVADGVGMGAHLTATVFVAVEKVTGEGEQDPIWKCFHITL
jgi:hypothetical protein